VPTTTQPSPEAFLDVYQSLTREGEQVLSLHISSEMSGTVRSAREAAGRVGVGRVTVVDSRLTSAPLGLIVLELARASRDGARVPELIALAERLVGRARVYFTVGSLDYLARGGRIGRSRALASKLTRVKPVMTIRDGRVSPVARVVGDRGVMARLADIAAGEVDGREVDTLGVVHAGRPDVVDWVRSVLAVRLGFREILPFELGCVVGAHAGPGTWGISYILPE